VTEGPLCVETRELFPELAIDVAAGDERARALRHLSGCPECRRELAATADVVDELLLLLPGHEPPVGFETSVMARLTPAPVREPAAGPEVIAGGGPVAGPARRLRLPLLWAASIVAVAVLAVGAVWWRTGEDRNLAADYRHTLTVAHGHGLSAAPLLVSGGAETGIVFAYEGAPSWLYVTFRSPPQPGEYEVEMVTTDGRRLALRNFTARPGSSGWGSTIPVSAKQVETLEFCQATVPVMTARF